MIPLALAAVLFAVQAPAETTRYWEQNLYQALAKGTSDGVALSSDGSLRLGPRFDLLKETDSAYLWAIEQDAQKNVYVAAGSPARIYKVTPNGQTSVFFESQELEFHSLAIDRQGRLYAAAGPDGPVYRITPDGKSSVFYDPKTKYIWDLAFDSKGNLYIATGDKGQIFRVTPAGDGKVFFSSDETHVRSLILDAQDNLFAGTEGSGLILRIRPDGTPFVLYESPKKEITALVLDGEGTLYAAAVGDKTVVPGQPPQPVAPQPAPVPPQPPKNPPSIFTMNLAGGSELYRITTDGSIQKLWSSRNDIVYSLALGAKGTVLAGTGNDGKIYEIEPGGPYVNLTHSPSSQVTALYSGAGEFLAAASNVGRIYRLRPELVSSGSFTSEVFDAGKTAQWGRLQWRQQLPADTAVRLETRSGNSSNTLLNWSAWKPARVEGNEAIPDTPRARFFQWKILLESKHVNASPQVSAVRAAYLPNNMPPVIDDVQNTPPGFRFQAIGIGIPPPQQPKSLSLPPIGSPPIIMPAPARTPQGAQMTGDKGYVGVRWFAYDDNDDTLTYSVYIRGEGEKEWKLLKDQISDMFYSWDSSNWPDGTYTVKVVASDSPSNPPGEALSASREGTSFEIDNTPPEIRDLRCTPDGKRIKIVFHSADRMSPVQGAEYSVDGGEWRAALPVNRVTDSRDLDFQFSSAEVSNGEHTVVVRATDRFQNEAVAKAVVNTGQSSH